MRTLRVVLMALAAAACVTVEAPTATEVGTATPVPPTPTPTATPTISPGPTATPTRIPTPGPTATAAPTLKPVPTATPVISTEGACGDPAFTLNDIRWTEPFEWYFNVDSVPERYDADAVLEVVERAFDNITDAQNDCGLPDRVSATAVYRGTTDEEPCGSSTNENVVGFGKPSGPDRDAIALMCPFGTDERISFAHVILSTRVTWAVSKDRCRGQQELLEPTLTHEIGHAFGLGHVGERRHGDLTMSTRSNGPCRDEESTLGLGDVLGLEELYGP